MLWLATLLGMVILSDATATTGSEPQVIEPPSWTRQPDDELKERLIPEFAMAIGISGEATVRCQVLEDGHPFICRVESESVPGLGFGSAARLIIASAEVRARRVDGIPTPGAIVSTVRFYAPAIEDRDATWNGPAPTAEGLRLARLLAEAHPEESEIIDDRMDGLDHDRRAVVRPWIEELIVPSPERFLDFRTVQLARLFSEDELQEMLDGRFPNPRTEEEWRNARAELSPQEQGSIVTLRDRYCARFECGVE